MVLKNRRPAIRNIALRRGESIVITVLSNLAECRRGWRINNYGSMRTAGHREGQQKGCECDPFLHRHVLNFEFGITPAFERCASWFEPRFGESVVLARIKHRVFATIDEFGQF
jgi:hypothetical protein